MYDIGLVTCADYAELHPEDAPLQDALARLGYSTVPVLWGSDVKPRLAYLVRSTWDYHLHPVAFAAWLRSLAASGPVVWNSAELMLWNMHKGYLLDLEARGVPIVPTTLVRAGEAWPTPAGVVVVKPAVGAGARGARMGPWESLEAHARELLADGDVLVQPCLASAGTYGERSLMFVDGRFCHAVRRTWAIVEGTGVDAMMPLVEPSADELQAAGLALAALPETPLYARVDLLLDAEGRACVLELELIEPRLFLLECPETAVALAQACVRRLAGS